jgi:hypothetical protein
MEIYFNNLYLSSYLSLTLSLSLLQDPQEVQQKRLIKRITHSVERLNGVMAQVNEELANVQKDSKVSYIMCIYLERVNVLHVPSIYVYLLRGKVIGKPHCITLCIIYLGSVLLH